MAKTRTFTIEQRQDGKWLSRNEFPKDSPLGVDPSEGMAIGSARREATLTSRAEGCTVIIKVKRGNKWQEVDRVQPP